MQLELYDTATRKKRVFEPIDPARISLYVCGPTVYGPAHIGNARPAIIFDVLARLLRHLYPSPAAQLIYARNITDLDDKINKKAADEGVDIEVITARYRTQYHNDMAALGVLKPDIEPHATAHIADMVAMIEQLVASGHAYEAEGHVLFDVAKDPQYGSLSGRKGKDMLAGARVEPAPFKRNAADFILWKPSSSDLPGWSSPWGRGRPGWHIECSAMAKKHLGETIDIHGGGLDLQFPHHENECAQSRCAHNAPLARFWLHNGLLTMSGDKMSKSQGNIKLVTELLDEAPGEAVRLALLQTHYRHPLDFTPDLVSQSVKNLDRLYGLLRDKAELAPTETEAPPQFMAALCDDLNTPEALAALFALAKQADTPQGKGALLAAGKMLGLLQQEPEDWFAGDTSLAQTAEIESLIAERARARAAKNYALADEMRDKLAAMGVAIEDVGEHTKWRRMR